MKIIRAYKTGLEPTFKQVRELLQHAGCARWAYNWGLRKKIDAYKATGKSPTAVDLHRELNLLKKVSEGDGGVPWMYESSKCAPQEALRNLDKAYQGFFRRCKAGAKKKGFPRFKSRKNGVGSFRLTGTVRVEHSHVKLPTLGKIQLKERGYLPTKGVDVLSATISEKAGRWYVSLQVEVDIAESTLQSEHVIGVDVGISHLAVTSDGEVFENPKALTVAQQTLRVRQKAVSRKIKGSSNRKKAVAQLARAHQRVANIRKDAIHKMTTAITKRATVLIIETLNVSGMLKNHCLARALSDASMSEAHRQIEYKSRWAGVAFWRADRFEPTSKRCSGCDHKKSLGLSERTYCCDECGLQIDRDLNAALNLKQLWPQVLRCQPSRPKTAGRTRKSPAKVLAGRGTEPGESDV